MIFGIFQHLHAFFIALPRRKRRKINKPPAQNRIFRGKLAFKMINIFIGGIDFVIHAAYNGTSVVNNGSGNHIVFIGGDYIAVFLERFKLVFR